MDWKKIQTLRVYRSTSATKSGHQTFFVDPLMFDVFASSRLFRAYTGLIRLNVYDGDTQFTFTPRVRNVTCTRRNRLVFGDSVLDSAKNLFYLLADDESKI